MERCSLTGPLYSEAAFSCRLGGSVQCFSRVIGDRVITSIEPIARCPRGEKVGQATSRATRDRPRHDRMSGPLSIQGSAIRFVGTAFGAGDERCPELRGDCPQIKRRADSSTIHDPAGDNDRHRGVRDEHVCERHRPKLIVGQRRIEHPSRSARFPALCHNHVYTSGFDLPRFIQACRGDDQSASNRFKRRDPISRGHAEMIVSNALGGSVEY